jgi:hypothetical protein
MAPIRPKEDLAAKGEDIATVEPVSSSNLSDTEKAAYGNTNIPDSPTYDEDGEIHYTEPATTARDLVTEVIHARDDPTLNPWTFRTWFLGAHHDSPKPG